MNLSLVKNILVYGSLLGGAMVLIKLIESGYHLKHIGTAHYVGTVAICFLFIGLVFGLKLNAGTRPVMKDKPAKTTPAETALSEREEEVLKLLCKGLSNREIAEKLYISVHTTKSHLSNIFAKLGVKNRTEAVLNAKERGMGV